MSRNQSGWLFWVSARIWVVSLLEKLVIMMVGTVHATDRIMISLVVLGRDQLL